MSQDNVEIVRRTIEGWNRGDASAIEAWDPTVEIEASVGGDLDGRYNGHDGLAKLLRFWGAFGSYLSEIEEWMSSGDEVFAQLHHYATGRSSGVEVEMRTWQVFTVRGEKIVRWRLFATRVEALEAAGLSE
jgi:ketosteroid isomerase-like protein